MWQFLTKVNIYLSILNTLSKNLTISFLIGESDTPLFIPPNSHFLFQGQVTSEQQFQFVPRQPQETQTR